MYDDNYRPYGSEELEETMFAGGDIFREGERTEKTKSVLKLVKVTRDQIAKKKEVK